MNHNSDSFVERCINTIRFLSVDAVQKAASGHPGTPMGMATAAFVLWDRFLKHNPGNPEWPNRDRFVLSAGHASMLLYSLLHLTGYSLPLAELKKFRQWRSRTPGHPEYGHTPGVEVTTGPLGQGFANGIGMAIAERWLAARYNREDHVIIDHYTYGIISDGDMMEGVASEAASLAGTLRLAKLIYIYDDNQITIDGTTQNTFREDVGARFRAYGWHVQGPLDGFDPEVIAGALDAAQRDERPSLIMLRTIIGYGSPNQGDAVVHGSPLGLENVLAAKKRLGWPLEPTFLVPEDVRIHMRKAVVRGAEREKDWQTDLAAYRAVYPDEAAALERVLRGELPPDWDDALDGLFTDTGTPIATRAASGKVMNVLAEKIDNLVGGSADLAASNKTYLKGKGILSAADPGSRNLYFGIREHAMGSIANGMALHGGIHPFTATFFVFSDYMRPPMRLAAMMGLPVIHIFSHDSFQLGEDGPTHQPVEHLMNLRAIPNLVVIRPCDAGETAEAWRVALANRTGPTTLVLSRQKLPVLDRNLYPPASELARGAYILSEPAGEILLIILASGSEVGLALAAAERMGAEGIGVRVVAMPSWELFERQTSDYRLQVLPPAITKRLAVEAGARFGWERYIGAQGDVIGLDSFGASAPAEDLRRYFGFTVEQVVERALALLGKVEKNDPV